MNDLGLYISKYVCKRLKGDINFKLNASSKRRHTFQISNGCSIGENNSNRDSAKQSLIEEEKKVDKTLQPKKIMLVTRSILDKLAIV